MKETSCKLTMSLRTSVSYFNTCSWIVLIVDINLNLPSTDSVSHILSHIVHTHNNKNQMGVSWEKTIPWRFEVMS